MDLGLLALFIPTFFLVSISPGMCMTLALTLGMAVGVRRSMWMMAGELTGVALVALAAVLGVAALMLNYPGLFTVLRYVGGAYLLWLGWKLWHAPPPNLEAQSEAPQTRWDLALQGFTTAVSNPKGWAFMVALLPPFLRDDLPLWSQMAGLLAVIVIIEFSSLMLYASGGKHLSRFLARSGGAGWLNRIAGSLMGVVGVWLALG
ncbi:LysE family translocator [Simiduia sp. 21SJ11W-1]|uniref:LysE family translocator n=1 Tax=Simiduia sp. 21SJ11W-1 TaxID=2909669 RepID=UPI00209F11C1|nr:LysE family translocator [Simiduia sp. 21SJ11W-1]UTA48771.1 LysE family translocator [Simiduia sp. 21SJ11W-1]